VTSAAVEAWRGADETGADDQRATEGPAPEGIDRRIIDLGSEARGKSRPEMLEMAATKIETLQTVRINVDRLDEIMNLVGE
jgi:chemotaxis protein histidine kinase CheA